MKEGECATILGELVKQSENGQKGFMAAAEMAKDTQLKAVFGQFAQECAAAAGELQETMRSMGATPPDRGTVAGALHRGFVKAKGVVEDPDMAALEECERGEDHAKAAYAKALKANLPASVRVLLERQHAGVIRHHDRVRELRDSRRAAKH